MCCVISIWHDSTHVSCKGHDTTQHKKTQKNFQKKKIFFLQKLFKIFFQIILRNSKKNFFFQKIFQIFFSKNKKIYIIPFCVFLCCVVSCRVIWCCVVSYGVVSCHIDWTVYSLYCIINSIMHILIQYITKLIIFQNVVFLPKILFVFFFSKNSASIFRYINCSYISVVFWIEMVKMSIL